MRIAIALVLFATGAARADNFFEADVAAVIPAGDDQYDDDVGNSVKLGVRVGTETKFGGLDFGIDFTPFSDDLSSQFLDVSIQRYRFMLGARYVHPINPRARIYVRAAGGLDLLHYHAQSDVVGFEGSETDAGIAVQFDGGILVDVGRRVSVGGRLGIPIAFHFNGDDPQDQTDADLDYTGVDIDFAFTLQARF